MLEVISPNVSLILSLNIRAPVGVYQVKLHPRGVIEIDTVDTHDTMESGKLLADVVSCFEDYESAGHLYPVNVTGLPVAPGSSPDVGSVRFCAWDAEFADILTNIIRLARVPELYSAPLALWKFECVSKYFRFMRYSQGGEHYPHYDSDFVVKINEHLISEKVAYATKYSLVMYFNDCETGEIAFINHDGKDKSDWARQATDDEVFLKIKPRAGKIVMFPHDVCHTVLPFTDGGSRYIVRGDLIFTMAV